MSTEAKWPRSREKWRMAAPPPQRCRCSSSSTQAAAGSKSFSSSTGSAPLALLLRRTLHATASRETSRSALQTRGSTARTSRAARNPQIRSSSSSGSASSPPPDPPGTPPVGDGRLRAGTGGGTDAGGGSEAGGGSGSGSAAFTGPRRRSANS